MKRVEIQGRETKKYGMDVKSPVSLLSHKRILMKGSGHTMSDRC